MRALRLRFEIVTEELGTIDVSLTPRLDMPNGKHAAHHAGYRRGNGVGSNRN